MDKVELALANLKEALFNEPIIAEYFRVKKLVEESDFLHETERKLKELQQKMTNHVREKLKHDEYKKQYKILLIKYEQHPYVVNYNYLVNEVNNLLLELKLIIE